MRIRRTLLITPGNRPERIAKAATLAADGLVLDLEDGVAPADKPTARRCIGEVLAQLDFGRKERIVRLNACGTADQEQDLAALPVASIDALMVPKVERADDMAALARRLQAMEQAAGARQPVTIIASIETPRGLFAAAQIAASPRISALFFGSGDYSLATGSAVTERALAVPRALIVAAASMAGVQAIDAAYFGDVTDAAATEKDALIARELGFVGKLLFHPNQIAPCNRAFSPSAQEIAKARRIIAAYEAAVADGRGTAVVDGTFIAVDIALMAKRTLALAERIAQAG
jgi:citrate lyase subunit beta/citryl-CoA lyase